MDLRQGVEHAPGDDDDRDDALGELAVGQPTPSRRGGPARRGGRSAGRWRRGPVLFVGRCRLDISWGRLTLAEGSPMVLQGWIDRPDEGVAKVLSLLGGPGLTTISQWVNARGQLWRQMPFDESMLDVDDPRLPADIKESIRSNRARAARARQSRKPWWRFW